MDWQSFKEFQKSKHKEAMEKKNFYRICVCGGRDYNDHTTVFEVLGTMLKNYPKDQIIIINGDSRGADKLSQIWAEDNDIKLETYPAQWQTHGKSAGPIRNKLMLDNGIDVLVAFPGGKGTANMIKICKEVNVYVYEVEKEWIKPKKEKEELHTTIQQMKLEMENYKDMLKPIINQYISQEMIGSLKYIMKDYDPIKDPHNIKG